MTVSIVIADDFPALRTGVRAWLEDHADFQVIGEARDGPETIRLVTRLQPQVLVIDMHMPGLNGTDVLALVRQQSLRTRGVVFSKGALAYVLKTSAAPVLVQAVRCAAEGAYFLDAPFSDRPLEVYLKKARAHRKDPLENLTRREKEVLHFVAEGYSSAEIAGRLHLSPRTVEQHRAHLMRKLHFRNQTELICFALRRGIISLED